MRAWEKIVEVSKSVSSKGLVKAAQELRSNTGIESGTITSFLNELLHPSTKNRIIVCDEATMLGSLQAEGLVDRCNGDHERILWKNI
ncbi:AAA family ATPase [Desulfotignum phosphitoxidans]|uniref:AAA family ATPase n=1 Tax=Desulfotignum phosphitoxidans TaxID=190898 RepID=UPI000A00C99A